MVQFAFFVALLLTVQLVAWWRGGAPERLMASAFLMAWIVSFLVDRPAAGGFEQVWLPILLVDLALLVMVMGIALKANRRWPLIIASMQLIIILAHGARALDPAMMPRVYQTMTWLWPYVQMLVLLVATLAHHHFYRRHGSVAAWTSSSASARRPLGQTRAD